MHMGKSTRLKIGPRSKTVWDSRPFAQSQDAVFSMPRCLQYYRQAKVIFLTGCLLRDSCGF
jgi:hypothetical protein